MKKNVKNISLSAALVTGIVLQPLNVFAETRESAPIQKVNWSVGSTVTANDSEANWTANKAIDGIVNREAANSEQSRWSTNRGTTSKVLTVDLKSQKTFDKFVIEWERANIKGFKIEVSTDGSTYTPVYQKPDDTSITNLTTKITLEQAATAQYVRLSVDNYDGGSINWASVSLYEFMVLGNGINVAANADVIASADGQEASTFSADKAKDSLLNTRWASPVNHNEHSLALNFGSAKKLRGAVIEWERLTATQYKIQSSMDNTNWADVKTFTAAPTQFRQEIDFGREIDAQYLRVLITTFVDKGPDRSGKDVTWATVSILEFEVYENTLDTTKQLTIDSVIQDLEVPEEINISTNTLDLPAVPEGFTLDFIGADYEQIIDKERKIHRPLVDTDVQVNFKVNNGNNSKDTSAYTIKVKGRNTVEANDNTKPVVIPELAEWKGSSSTDGNFTINDNSRIMINPTHKSNLDYMSKEFQKDYKDITGNDIQIVEGSIPNDGDFYFTLGSSDAGLKEEGYIMNVNNSVKVEAVDKIGAYWATRSILQILKQNNDFIPKGTARDYPKYKVRGFMLDVARKPFSKSIVDDVIKQMSWYKMNDFQIHLNDNYIFLEEYASDEEAMTAYSGFRLESDIKAGGNGGLNKADLTSADMHYTKAEFKKMIDDSAKIGIKVIPEFDSPGHALPFTKVRPDLRLKTVETGQVKRRNEQLDLSSAHYDDSIGFIESIWDEYIDDGTFAGTDVVNIGTDEYYGNKENFRKYSDDLIKYVESKGKTARMWGSLSYMPGTTPVKSENVQLNVWNTGWSNPTAMYNSGYDLINMVDGSLYIVPGANYYNDYLNSSNLYQNWQPNTMGGTTIPAGSDQMLGSAFAIWNDSVDRRANGLTELDIYDRFKEGIPALSSKLWGDGKDLNYSTLDKKADIIDDAPNTNPYSKQSSIEDKYLEYTFDENAIKEDSSKNDRDIKETTNITNKNETLKLNGGKSYAETPMNKLGTGNTLSFDIKLDTPAKPGNILFEADSEYYTHDIRIMKDGSLGFTRELYDYSFNYVLPINQTVHLSVTTANNKTSLFVNGKEYKAVGEYVDNGVLKSKNISKSSLLLPTQRIGSKTNAINAEIDNIVISTGVQGYPLVNKTNFTATSDNQNSDGLISYAFDNDPSTMWHSQWSPSKKPLPATIEIDMKSKLEINGFKYQTRSGSTNGNITKYTLSYKDDSDQWIPIIENGTFNNQSGIKDVFFKPIVAQNLKLVVKEGEGALGSAAEFDFFAGNDDLTTDSYIANVFISDTSHGSVSISKNNVGIDEEITFTATPKKGFTFNGWYDETDKLASDEVSYKTTITRNTTLTAKFDKIAEADKTELNTAIDKTTDLVETTYTKSSWIELINKLKVANDVKEDSLATVDEVKDATDALENVIGKLVTRATISEINNIKSLANDLESLKDNYTKEEFAKAQQALDEVHKLLTKYKEEITSIEVKEAISKLTNVKKELPSKAELSSLKALVNHAEKVLISQGIDNVQPSRIKALQVALNVAQQLINNNSQDQKAIQTAFNDLTIALNRLDKIVDKRELQDAINKAKKLVETHYTKESWSVFKKALDSAIAINHDNASLDEVNDTIELLTKATNQLVKQSHPSIDTGDTTSILSVISIAGLTLVTSLLSRKKKEQDL